LGERFQNTEVSQSLCKDTKTKTESSGIMSKNTINGNLGVQQGAIYYAFYLI